MIAGVPQSAVVVILLVVLLGAFVQSAVGLGLGMVVTPVVAMSEPDLVPTLPLLLMLPVAAVVLLREHPHLNRQVLGWTLATRVPGTLLGAWLLTVLSTRALGVAIALLVLAGVWIAVSQLEVPHTPPVLVSAGLLAGTGGTVAAIDGPPLVVLLADRSPGESRATMSCYFLIGGLISLGWLGLQGQFPRASMELFAWCLPVVAVAMLLGTVAGSRLPRETFRRGVLALCAVSALLLLVRSVIG